MSGGEQEGQEGQQQDEQQDEEKDEDEDNDDSGDSEDNDDIEENDDDVDNAEEEEEEEEDEDEDDDDDDDDDDAEEDDDDEEEAEAWSPGDRIGVRAISRSSPSPPPTHMATAPEDRPMLESHENEEQCAAHIRGWLMGLSDIEATFDRLDVNRDGFLSRGELEALVESGGESISAAAACSPSGIARYCQRSSFRLTSPRRSSPQN